MRLRDPVSSRHYLWPNSKTSGVAAVAEAMKVMAKVGRGYWGGGGVAVEAGVVEMRKKVKSGEELME